VSAQSSSVLTYRNCLAEAVTCLQQAGVEDPRFEAEYLLMALLEVGKVEMFLHGERLLSPEKAAEYQSMLNRRLRLEPLQYIVGKVEFWSRDFRLSPEVLIPRQETEFVLERILAHISEQSLVCENVLDMGTGSGVIADVLASDLDCRVLAVDSSYAALKVAQDNIFWHHLQSQVSFLCSDLFSGISQQFSFDLIVSNPPYVAESEKRYLYSEVLDYEPSAALFAGVDGLSCYRRLIPESLSYLRSGGWLCLEIGASQGRSIVELLQGHGFHEVDILTDYADRPRLALGKKI